MGVNMFDEEEAYLSLERTGRRSAEISLIPLINVVFLLLIFFLVAGTIKTFDVVEVDVPVAENSRTLDEGYIEIILGRHDEIILNDELVSPAQLREGLKEQLTFGQDRVITIKADQSLAAAKMLSVMEMIKALGGRHVSLITQEG